mgnify:FL=1
MSEDTTGGTMLVKKLKDDVMWEVDGGYTLSAIVKVDGKTFETELYFDSFNDAYDFYTHWWKSDVVEIEGDE